MPGEALSLASVAEMSDLQCCEQLDERDDVSVP